MQYGIVNGAMEATVTLNVMADNDESLPITFVIDTGATGDASLPQSIIDSLDLPLVEDADDIVITLADGTTGPGRLYLARVLWHDRIRHIEVVNLEGAPLVGMALLYGSNLNVDTVPGGLVTITELSAVSLPETPCG